VTDFGDSQVMRWTWTNFVLHVVSHSAFAIEYYLHDEYDDFEGENEFDSDDDDRP
jgi:hypothetical protein